MRFIGSVLIASGAVMLLLAFALSTVVTQRLVDTKIDVADSQIDRARATVEQQINATGSSSSMQVRLNSARASLTSQSQNTAETPAVFEPVLIVEGIGGEATASPEATGSRKACAISSPKARCPTSSRRWSAPTGRHLMR